MTTLLKVHQLPKASLRDLCACDPLGNMRRRRRPLHQCSEIPFSITVPSYSR